MALSPLAGLKILTLFESGWWPTFKLHAQSQTAGSQHFLDFIERLATQIWSLQQLVLGALNQVTDVIDVFGLEAVGGTNRQLQLIDRTQQDRDRKSVV